MSGEVLFAPPWPEMDSETVRQMLLNGVCPECGEGSFAAIGQHLWKKHGINSYAAKEQARIPKHQGLLAPETRAAKQEISRRLYREVFEQSLQSSEARAKAKATPRRLSAVGYEANRRKAASIPVDTRREAGRRAAATKLAADPQFYSRLGASAPHKNREDRQWLTAVTRTAQVRAKVPRSEYEAIKMRAAQGEKHGDIAASYDVCRSFVSRIVRGEADRLALDERRTMTA